MKHTFRIQFASDLHLEFHDKNQSGSIPYGMFLKPVADYLALCGDIGIPEKPALTSFLKWCSDHFRAVFWIPGNHEFYIYKNPQPLSIPEKLSLCEEIARQFPNVHFLHRRSVEIPEWNLRILGCTFWTEIDPINDSLLLHGMNDVRQIFLAPGKNAMPNDFRRMHEADKAWLSNQLQKAADEDKGCVVLTHHLPTYKLIHEKYHGHPMNFCFASDQEQMIQSPVRGWLCGHSHTGNSVLVNGIPCCLNPYGYPGEPGTNYNREKVLEFICEPCETSGDFSVEYDDFSSWSHSSLQEPPQ